MVTENITGLLKYNEVNSFWGSKEAYKEFDYEWDYSNNMGFIVTNAKIRRNDDLDQANISTENVFQHLSFRNVKINFAKSDGTNAHSKYFNFKPTKDKSYRVLKANSLKHEQIQVTYTGTANSALLKYVDAHRIQHRSLQEKGLGNSQQDGHGMKCLRSDMLSCLADVEASRRDGKKLNET